MASFLLYIIKSGCCLALFYAGYKALLSAETFFHFNRNILLTGMLACMLLPLVKIRTETAGMIQQPMMQLEKIMAEDDRTFIITANDETVITSMPTGKRNLPVNLPALIFIAGFFVNICLLVRSHISLYLLIRSGRKITSVHCTVTLLDKPVIPFNYGRYVILSEKDYGEHQDAILTHEMAHYRFLHSLDVVLVELLILLQWFNPFVRLLKNELRKIHEYQADAEVLKTGVDATKYQLLLLKKTVGSGPYTFANSFNHNKLKTRFIMMSKKKSNSWARMKLLALLPVAALSVYAFARPEATQQIEQVIRSESTTIPPNNQNFTLEFFEAELNRFIREQGGNADLSSDEKRIFLTMRTNVVMLLVNTKDEVTLGVSSVNTKDEKNEILFRGSLCPIERLSAELTKKLVDDYPDKNLFPFTFRPICPPLTI
jgi:hypothetical protein